MSYGNYLVVTIKYIKNHKCVFTNYFYNASIIFFFLSLSLFFYWVFWIVQNKNMRLHLFVLNHAQGGET